MESRRSSRCGPSGSWPTCARRCRATRSSCTDVGWNKNGVGQQFPIYTPGTFITPSGFATMGFGPPAALGVKIAHPDRVVVALVGDGGFGQNPSVLATAMEADLAVVWVVMNNDAFGTIAGLEAAHYGTTFGTMFEKNGKTWSPDYAAIARAYGIDGVKVSVGRRIQAGAARRRSSRKRPVVIDVVHAERADADRRALEHHGHLFAGQEGASRQHRRRRARRLTASHRQE